MKAEPFKIDISQAKIDSILARVRGAALPDAPEGGPGNAWAYGTPVRYMKEIAAYWTGSFDWRKAEAGLNRFPQFKARIGELDIHFVHEKGSNTRPRPLILSHGWPGSIFEFQHIIEPLAHPERFGGKTEDGFDVVVPSLPGYGFSGKPKKPMSPRSVARLFDVLMTDALGYDAYLAQGGDWGSTVSGWLGYEGKGCKAVHLNMMGWFSPGVVPETKEEQDYQARFQQVFDAEGAYFRLQMTKPLSLSYAMADSPLGQAAWIIEKFKGWSHIEGDDIEAAYTKDQLLTNIMIYLVTDTFATSTWMYRGLMEDPGGAPIALKSRVERPCAIANFPHDFLVWPPRSLAERHFNIVRWTEMGEGGHFAALERPQKFIEDVRGFAGQIGF